MIPFIPPVVRATDANANPLSGALWYFYTTGTLTPATVYTTYLLTVAHPNPVVADSGGLFPNIYLDPGVTYRCVLKTAGGSTIADIDPYASPVTVAGTTNKIFTQDGAVIYRLGDKIAVGGATVSDFSLPNVTKDWLSSFQVSAGLSNGAPISANLVSLTNDHAGDAVGIVGGAQSLHFTSASTNAIANSAYVINNNASLATNAWAFYGEAHKTIAAPASDYGAELEVRSLVATVTPNPNQQGDAIGLQIGAGCGLSASGQFDCSAAIQIVANPMKWKAGINFLAGSLVPTSSIADAVMLPTGYRIGWFDASNNIIGGIYSSVATAANATILQFSDAGTSVFNNAGQTLFNVPRVASAANYISAGAAVASSAPYLAAIGSDSNINLQLSPKGTGGVIVGANSTPLTKIVAYTPSITPASVAAATVAEQTFTVAGLTTADKVIVNPPAIGNSTGIAGARVSAADTLAIRFTNPTAGALTPTAGTYTVLAFRS